MGPACVCGACRQSPGSAGGACRRATLLPLPTPSNPSPASHSSRRDRYPPAVRVFLWLMAELAIVGSDIQEVIGTALALSLLSGGAIPLWAGVLTAAAVAFLLLALERAGVRWLERTFQGFVAVMVLAMGAVFFRAGVDPAQVARGMLLPKLPRSTIAIACGLLGAIIMPHNLFLHSALVHARPLGRGRRVSKRDSIRYYNMESGLALLATLFINTAVICVFAASVHGTPEADNVGLANAGQILGARYGRAVVRGEEGGVWARAGAGSEEQRRAQRWGGGGGVPACRAVCCWDAGVWVRATLNPTPQQGSSPALFTPPLGVRRSCCGASACWLRGRAPP